MPPGIPVSTTQTCPRCKISRRLINIDGGITFRCSGCEWVLSLTAVAPTGTASATLSVAGTAITVASGGASFTNGMRLLYDTLSNAEVLTVNGASSGTNIPVTAAAKAHLSAVTFGQLAIVPALAGVGLDAVPNPGGWGY